MSSTLDSLWIYVEEIVA